MKVLFLTDVHASPKALEWVERMGAGYSAIIVGGDLSRGGYGGFAFEFLTRAVSTGRSVFYVPGNADSPELDIPEGVIRLHGRRSTVGGRTVGGLGGSNITQSHTPFELPDENARAILSEIGHVEILVAHCPPADTECDRASGRHIGSIPVREYVLEHRPSLVLSGHAHESKAIDTLGGATIVNPGPLMDGNYAEVDMNGEIGVELKSGAT